LLYDEELDEELLYDEREVELLRDELLLRCELLSLVTACERFVVVVRPELCDDTADPEREPVVVPRPTEPLRCCSNADA